MGLLERRNLPLDYWLPVDGRRQNVIRVAPVDMNDPVRETRWNFSTDTPGVGMIRSCHLLVFD